MNDIYPLQLSKKDASYTVYQPTIFPPVYLMSRYLSCDKVVWLGRDKCKPGYDGWHTQFKLQTKSQELVLPLQLIARKGKAIDDVQMHQSQVFLTKLRKTLTQHYGQEPHYAALMELVEEPFRQMTLQRGSSFAVLCKRFVEGVAEYLGASTLFVDEASLGLEWGVDASERLARIGTAINCNTYVCAEDALAKYLCLAEFKKAGVSLSPQKFVIPPIRCGKGYFEASTSILSLLAVYAPQEIRQALE